MVILRLRRQGRRHDPHYRIVAQEKRSKLNGQYIESIGHYHPADAKKQLVIDKELAKKWLDQGAQASVTVNNLLVKDGVLPKERKISRVFSPKKKEADESTKEAKVEKTEAKTEVEEAKTEKAEVVEEKAEVVEEKAETESDAEKSA